MSGICETYAALFWEKSHRRSFGNVNVMYHVGYIGVEGEKVIK